MDYKSYYGMVYKYKQLDIMIRFYPGAGQFACQYVRPSRKIWVEIQKLLIVIIYTRFPKINLV